MMRKKRGKKAIPLGKTLMKLRIDFDEKMAEMAEKLGISPGKLSMIETGHRGATKDFLETIVAAYHLDEGDERVLFEQARLGQAKLTFDLKNLSTKKRGILLELHDRHLVTDDKTFDQIFCELASEIDEQNY